MEELLDVAREMGFVEELLTAVAAILVILGLAVVAGGYFLDLSFLDELGAVIGVLIIVAGVAIYLAKSFVQEVLQHLV